MSNLKYWSRFLVLGIFLFCSGCLPGMVALMGSPTNYEKKIPAEYDLAKNQGKNKESKILVLVYQPSWLDSNTDLRYYITQSIESELTKKAKIHGDSFIGYDKLSNFRIENENFSELSPADVGKNLKADFVLMVSIESYKLEKMEDTDRYKGFLAIKGSLYDAADGNKLWPQMDDGKLVKVGFEISPNGQEVSVRQLTFDAAHCISRYLYDCIVAQFKIPDERTNEAWERWE
jgi:hypothetical protein